MSAIEVEAVSKTFQIPSPHRSTLRDTVFNLHRPNSFERLKVLDEVSFAVRQGEAVALMGRNGCGKSTLLKIISGIYAADQGRVSVRGRLTPVLELGLGWNFELDAVDNILLVGTVMGLSLRETRAAVGEILAFAELERFANLALKHYSSGMAVRLGYAVAFRAVREVLILDEVFSVGDAGFRAKCEERYLELRKTGHTMLLVSHLPDVVERFCDRALLLDGGKVVREGTALEVSGAYQTLLGLAPPSAKAADRNYHSSVVTVQAEPVEAPRRPCSG